MSERIRFDTKIAVLLRDDLAGWQALNVTAFLVSGVAAADPTLTGGDYADADGTRYLPMFRQPVLVFAGDQAMLAAAHERALTRGLVPAVFPQELFGTDNDADNRALVRTLPREKLALAGLALHGPRNPIDKILKEATLHR